MIFVSALLVKNAFFTILYCALWIRSTCFNDFNTCTFSKKSVLLQFCTLCFEEEAHVLVIVISALLVKNAFFYNFYSALWRRSACFSDCNKCTFSKERVLLPFCTVRFEEEAHVLVIVISALFVKNAFFYLFVQCPLNKKRMF